MFFHPLKSSNLTGKELRPEYKAAKSYGVIRLGSTCFFFRRGVKIYYITYKEIVRYFRRVMLIPTGTKRGDMRLETLIICDEKGELAQIQIPGVNAAKDLMDEMKSKAPHADSTCPDKSQEEK